MKTLFTRLDPLDHYTAQGAPLTWCQEACGLIPSFVDPNSDQLIIDDCKDAYGFPTSDLSGLVINGVYTYPGDEDLYPYMAIISGSETLYIYPYGIVASVFEKDGENTQLVTRLD